jgi:hypothetical protein
MIDEWHDVKMKGFKFRTIPPYAADLRLALLSIPRTLFPLHSRTDLNRPSTR